METTSTLHTIVAGIEHPGPGDATLPAAAALARWSGAALHLVHAYDHPPLHALGHPGAAARDAAGVRARLEAAAAGLPGAERAVCHAVRGPAAGALLHVAAEVDAGLIVVGAGGCHTLLGGTAERVLRDARVPVLVLRRPVRRALGRLLLATDLSELSAAAHERGLDLAAALFGGGFELRSALVVGAGALPAPLPPEALARTARAELRLFLRARRPRPARVEPVVRTGSPAEALVAEAAAWEADLLVLGTHGHVLLGSVAESVFRHAPCNVLAVPPAPVAESAPSRVRDSEPALAGV